MDLQLAGKVAAITGGNVGIGFEVARGLAREGVHVALCARDEASVVAAADQIAQECGVKALGVKVDVTVPADTERFISTVNATFDGADILINNAGQGTNETIMDAPDEKWLYYWELHVMAAIRLARGFVPSMKGRGGGVILNNASICATQPMYNEPIYNTTKAALVMMSKCLAHELIPSNIRVNVINPGLIETPGWTVPIGREVAGTNVTVEQRLDEIARQYAPIGRFASAEELAQFFVFLCSPRASYCVGSSYYVDGGWLNVVT
ncbi:MAG TPA: SDR family oxidoreductase [Phototrophicaceae bacterium]|nr:SDR family oxidoreductase [Phototrophicaceae bacterium]